MTQITVPCEPCSSTGWATHEDRHTETRQDQCRSCGGTGQVPARPGESRETSWPDAVPGAGQAAEVEEIGVQQGAPSGTGSRASIEPADAVSPASGGVDPSRGETLQTIAQWCEETFGPATAERIASRAAEEMDELLADPHKVEEAADVVIILSRHPTLWAEVERKMAVNRKRQWRLKGDGSGYHIPAPGIETGTATTEGRGAKHESPIAAGEALSPTQPDLIQAAREALEPFAKAAQAEHMRHIKDDQRLFLESRAEVVITENLRGGHFRAAQAALRALQSPVRQEEGSRGEGGGLTLRALHAANIARQAEWCPDQVPDLSFRGNELGGECGEAQNVIKKLERERQGWRGSRATKDDLAQELADVVICADLCAVTAGIDLDAAVVAKFNATSEKQGLTTMLLATNPTPDANSGSEAAELFPRSLQQVPWEPTAEMRNAGWRELSRQGVAAEDVEIVPIYRAMLSASPRPSSKEGQGA